MSKPKTKRFYKSVSVKEGENGWGVYLDDHLLKTPGKLSLIAQSKAHADLIATEWDAQGTIIKPHLMPVTRMVGRGGLEPPTSRLSGVRSNHLSYRPIVRSGIRQSRRACKLPGRLVDTDGWVRITGSEEI